MEKPDYTKMMNDKGDLIPITSETELKPGTLIGFRGFSGKAEKCTASYPVWAKVGSEIKFILFLSNTGRPTVDNTWIQGDNIFINKQPIIVDVPTNYPQTFQDRMGELFNGIKP